MSITGTRLAGESACDRLASCPGGTLLALQKSEISTGGMGLWGLKPNFFFFLLSKPLTRSTKCAVTFHTLPCQICVMAVDLMIHAFLSLLGPCGVQAAKLMVCSSPNSVQDNSALLLILLRTTLLRWDPLCSTVYTCSPQIWGHSVHAVSKVLFIWYICEHVRGMSCHSCKNATLVLSLNGEDLLLR